MVLLSTHINTWYRQVPKCKYLYWVWKSGIGAP